MPQPDAPTAPIVVASLSELVRTMHALLSDCGYRAAAAALQREAAVPCRRLTKAEHSELEHAVTTGEWDVALDYVTAEVLLTDGAQFTLWEAIVADLLAAGDTSGTGGSAASSASAVARVEPSKALEHAEEVFAKHPVFTRMADADAARHARVAQRVKEGCTAADAAAWRQRAWTAIAAELLETATDDDDDDGNNDEAAAVANTTGNDGDDVDDERTTQQARDKARKARAAARQQAARDAWAGLIAAAGRAVKTGDNLDAIVGAKRGRDDSHAAAGSDASAAPSKGTHHMSEAARLAAVFAAQQSSEAAAAAEANANAAAQGIAAGSRFATSPAVDPPLPDGARMLALPLLMGSTRVSVTSFTTSPASPFAAVGCDNGTAALVDLATLQRRAGTAAAAGAATVLATSVATFDAESWLVAGHRDGSVRLHVYDGAALTLRWEAPTAHTMGVTACAIIESSHVATCSFDTRVLLLSASSGRPVKSFTAHTSFVHDVAVLLPPLSAAEGCCLLSASGDGTVKRWNVHGGAIDPMWSVRPEGAIKPVTRLLAIPAYKGGAPALLPPPAAAGRQHDQRGPAAFVAVCASGLLVVYSADGAPLLAPCPSAPDAAAAGGSAAYALMVRSYAPGTGPGLNAFRVVVCRLSHTGQFRAFSVRESDAVQPGAEPTYVWHMDREGMALASALGQRRGQAPLLMASNTVRPSRVVLVGAASDGTPLVEAR